MHMEDAFDDFVKSTFSEMTRNLLPKGMITNFVVVAEITNGDTTDIAMSFSEGMSPWLADGMLRVAADMVASGRWEIRDTGEQGEV